jgi:hypothetical protein
MMDTFWTTFIALWLGALVGLVFTLLWSNRRSGPVQPAWQPDLHDHVDMIVEAMEQEECERLYGRLRTHEDVALQRGREQLL